jgi:hypothetical protein
MLRLAADKIVDRMSFWAHFMKIAMVEISVLAAILAVTQPFR